MKCTRNLFKMVRTDEASSAARAVTEYRLAEEARGGWAPFLATDSYVSWTRSGNLLHVEATDREIGTNIVGGIASMESETSVAPAAALDAAFVRPEPSCAFAVLDASDILTVYSIRGKCAVLSKPVPAKCTFLWSHASLPLLALGTEDGRMTFVSVRVEVEEKDADRGRHRDSMASR